MAVIGTDSAPGCLGIMAAFLRALTLDTAGGLMSEGVGSAKLELVTVERTLD